MRRREIGPPQPAAASAAATALAAVVDVLATVLLATGLAILLTGGGRWRIAEVDLGLNHATRPLLLAFALALLRWHRLGAAPLFGRSGWTTARAAGALAASLLGWQRRLERLGGRQVRLALAAIVGASLLVKVALALAHPGYLTGDDVEILEQSLAPLLGFYYETWDLRGPIYPLLFVRPVQQLALALGATDPASLVLAASLLVILFSSLNVVLLHAAARRLYAGAAVPLLAAGLLAAGKLPVALAASVLPRTVSTTFVLLAFLLLLPEGRGPAAPRARPTTPFLLAAAAALAFAVAIRFSEAIFLLPPLLWLWFERNRREAALLAASFLAASALLLGAGDLLAWARPFHSLEHIVRYTLVSADSSRGFQPPWHYLEILPSWIGPATAIFFLAALRREHRRVWLWALTPLALLSLLPHKEARYLLPALPFFALAAAAGLVDLLGRARIWWEGPAGDQAAVGAGGRRRPAAWLPDRRTGPLWIAGLLMLLLPLEADGYRLDRTDEAVRLAQRVAGAARGPLLAERSWRFGGWVHLCRAPRVAFLPPGSEEQPERLARQLDRRRPAELLLSDRLLRRPEMAGLLRARGWPVDEPAAPGTTGGGFRWLVHPEAAVGGG